MGHGRHTLRSISDPVYPNRCNGYYSLYQKMLGIPDESNPQSYRYKMWVNKESLYTVHNSIFSYMYLQWLLLVILVIKIILHDKHRNEQLFKLTATSNILTDSSRSQCCKMVAKYQCGLVILHISTFRRKRS